MWKNNCTRIILLLTVWVKVNLKKYINVIINLETKAICVIIFLQAPLMHGF
jgi:hypothetical protein